MYFQFCSAFRQSTTVGSWPRKTNFCALNQAGTFHFQFSFFAVGLNRSSGKEEARAWK